MFEIIGSDRNLTLEQINQSFDQAEEMLRTLPQSLSVEDFLDLLPIIKYMSLTSSSEDTTTEFKTDRMVHMLHGLGQWVHEDKVDDNNELKGKRLQRRLDAVAWWTASQGIAPLDRDKLITMTRLNKDQLRQMLVNK